MTREERRRRGFSHYNQNYERDDRRESEVRSSENERRRCSRLGCVGPAAAVIALGGEVLGPAAGPVVAFGLRGPSLGGGFVFEDFGDVAGGGAEVPLVVALFGAAGRADAEADGDGEEAGAGQERHEAQQIKRGVAAWHDGVVSGRGLGGSPRGGGRRRLGGWGVVEDDAQGPVEVDVADGDGGGDLSVGQAEDVAEEDVDVAEVEAAARQFALAAGLVTKKASQRESSKATSRAISVCDAAHRTRAAARTLWSEGRGQSESTASATEWLPAAFSMSTIDRHA
eukprot:CAMPEP_0198663888 /NCGR_PEP_ID=MMETSP1467-20131203/53764_1 /TAXON_ID=1462469 /ORGANISM="unid. sp., Strain CCMP2135" /LENGTH=282 /DNA_ID=CAMNT_0044400433 /DNA_START=61 /DNA_END=913 /DNA_ORIENTATION=+